MFASGRASLSFGSLAEGSARGSAEDLDSKGFSRRVGQGGGVAEGLDWQEGQPTGGMGRRRLGAGARRWGLNRSS